MLNPDTILGIVESKAKIEGYQYQKLYKHLLNIEFYKKAYANIYAKPGNMTEGIDGKTIDGFSLEEVQKLIEAMKNESYQPKPARRVLIDKKNSTQKRPIGIPAFYDKLVQEILRSILEAIYEPNFSNTSHGFRPKRSCHTALSQVKTSFTGTKWWIKGDIKGFFDHINHNTLINILKKRIDDERFIRLIWKFLKAGYIYEGTLQQTYGGSPQGGIVSPILANIYLNELDKMMEKKCQEFNTSKRQRRANPDYKVLSERIESRVRKLDKPDEEQMAQLKQLEEDLLKERADNAKNLPKGTVRANDNKHRAIERRLYKVRQKLKIIDDQERQDIIAEIKELRKERKQLPAMDNFDPDFKRMRYVRYADDFLIGMIGTKEEAEETKEFLSDFLTEQLGLELSQEETCITHNSKKVRFLGYDIFIAGSDHDRVTKVAHNSGRIVKARTLTGGVKLSIPHEKLKDFIVGKGYAKDMGDGKWKEQHRPELLNNEPIEIIMQVNAEFRGFYQYYKLAFDVREKILNAHWIWSKSVTKTLAGKFKTKTSKLRYAEIEINGVKHKQFYRQGTWGCVWVNSKNEVKFMPLVKREEIQYVREVLTDSRNSNLQPQKGIHYGRTSIIQRLNAERCEHCGDTKGPFEVHHIRKLSDLKKKKNLQDWEKFMIARNRKTKVLCGNGSKNNCHLKLHNGTL